MLGDKIALNYNIIPDIKNGYVVDSIHKDKIGFSLFENEDILYYNGKTLEIVYNRFEIPISGLSGKHDFTISNSLGESVSFIYYISDKNGYLEDFVLEELKDYSKQKTYIKTINGVSIIYTNKEKYLINRIEKTLLNLPQNMLVNLKEIKLLPLNHESGAAGITKYDKISFYNLSKYSLRTFKNIVIHEIAHTWTHNLINKNVLNYLYSDYQKAVKLDTKFPSNYAKENVKAGNYSEDFAESVSFYLINPKAFERKYPARADYIKNIIDE